MSTAVQFAFAHPRLTKVAIAELRMRGGRARRRRFCSQSLISCARCAVLAAAPKYSAIISQASGLVVITKDRLP